MFRIDDPSNTGSLPAPAAVGTEGYFKHDTKVTRDWANAVQEEIAQAIEAAGITLDKTAQNQLALAIAAIAGKRIQYVADTGAANAYAATIATQAGKLIVLNPAHSNTGGSTFNNGAGARAIKRVNAIALGRYNILAGTPALLLDDGTVYWLLNPCATTFVSSQQSVPAAGGTADVAHGLGVAPDEWDGYLVNISTDLGYAVGDRVKIPSSAAETGTDSHGITLAVNDTNIRIIVPDANSAPGIYLPNKTTPNTHSILDNTKWKIVVWGRFL